jgi:ABC-2 type transport system ATP-binding protein
MIPPRSVSPSVTAEGICKSFGSLRALDGVTLSLAAGECLAILGPNGAGKTTLCEIIEGLLLPDSGTVEILGLPLRTMRQVLLEKIGVQLQETTLYKKYTVRETVELFASFYQQPVPIPELLAKLRLSDKQHSRLEHLSGGQKQRAYLACSLVNNPQVMFLDEPTNGLDPRARRQIWDLLQEVKKDGRSIILTTHNMEEAQALADRIAIMDQGKILAVGSYQELLDRYCAAKIFSYLVSPEEQAQLAEAMPWLASARVHSSQYEVQIENAAERLPQFIRAADQLSIKIVSLGVRQSTLEDVFLQITARDLHDA